LKQQVNPVVATVAVILILVVAGFLVWRGTAGTAGPGPMQKGNPGPFSPGGAAVGKGGGMPSEASNKSANPFAPKSP